MFYEPQVISIPSSPHPISLQIVLLIEHCYLAIHVLLCSPHALVMVSYMELRQDSYIFVFYTAVHMLLSVVRIYMELGQDSDITV
jgi:hypothetical protein